MKHFVVQGCINPDCTNKSYKRVVRAISMDTAKKVSEIIKSNSNLCCSDCGNKLSFYGLEVEDKTNSNS